MKPKAEIKELTTTVRLTQEQSKKLKRLAKADERSVSFLLRKAVSEYLSKH